MKPILAAIFVVGMSVSPLMQQYRNLLITPDGAAALDGMAKMMPFEIVVGNIHIIDTSALCPWWIDPEVWWREDCTGGLPPRLPVPEALR